MTIQQMLLGVGAGSVDSDTFSTTGVTTNLVQHVDFGKTACYDPTVNTWNVSDLSGNNNHLVIGNGSNLDYGNIHSSATTQLTNVHFNTANGGYLDLNQSLDNISGRTYSQSTNAFPKLSRLTDVWPQPSSGIVDFALEYWVNPYFGSKTSTYPQSYLTSDFHNLDRRTYFDRSSNKLVSGPIGSYSYASGTTIEVTISQTMTLNQYFGWQYIVVTQNGTGSNNFKIYINNQNIYTSTTTYSNANLNRSGVSYPYTWDGFWNDQNNNIDGSFDGKWAIVRFYYNKGLSASEVTQNWDSQRVRFGL
tara:strand:- start:2003 stop:2917 length:915 start_codon:yes stop_codon:yes gene_type:complete